VCWHVKTAIALLADASFGSPGGESGSRFLVRPQSFTSNLTFRTSAVVAALH
jgi:hypothetical protein